MTASTPLSFSVQRTSGVSARSPFHEYGARRDGVAMAARKIVENSDVVSAVDEHVRHHAADVSCPACDENPHLLHLRSASATGSRRLATHEPLIQLARGEARNATASPTSSARPKRPNGSSALNELGDPRRIGLLTFVPRAAGKENRSGRHAVDANVVFGQLLRHRLGEADLGRLHGVVDHPSAGLASPDRRNHDDDAAAASAACAARRAATSE